MLRKRIEALLLLTEGRKKKTVNLNITCLFQSTKYIVVEETRIRDIQFREISCDHFYFEPDSILCIYVGTYSFSATNRTIKSQSRNIT